MSTDRRSFLKSVAASAAFAAPAPAVVLAQSPQTAARPPSGKGGLSRTRLELMTADHITAEQKAASDFFPGFWDNRGWGFGMTVVTRRDDVARPAGTFGWDGGYGTSWYADPREDMSGILMTQRVWDSPVAPAVNRDFWTSAYQAIDD